LQSWAPFFREVLKMANHWDPSATFLSSRDRDYTSPYEFAEYPKWVTDAEGRKHLVENSEQEALHVPPTPDDESEEPAPSVTRDALFAEASALGLNPHHRAGEQKLRDMIAAAKPKE